MAFEFLEYDGDVPFAFDRPARTLFRMDGAEESKWVKMSAEHISSVLRNCSVESRENMEDLAREREDDLKPSQKEKANTSSNSNRLTQSEINSLRQDKKATAEFCTRYFKENPLV